MFFRISAISTLLSEQAHDISSTKGQVTLRLGHCKGRRTFGKTCMKDGIFSLIVAKREDKSNLAESAKN